MTLTVRRLLALAAVTAVILGGTSAGLALAAIRTIPTPLRPPLTAHRLTALTQRSRVAEAPRALPDAELPRDWRDHGSWSPAISHRGAATTSLALYLGPTAGWLPCTYAPTGVSVTGRPMTYRCAPRPGSAAGAITLVAPLVHRTTGWWEQAATNSTRDADTYEAFRVATLTRASNGRPWYVTTRPQLVRLEPPPPSPSMALSLGLRPGSQRVPAGHPAGLTVTGSGWPSGAYAELWDLTDNVNTTPTVSDWCTAPNCQWMVPAHRSGAYEFTVYLHARSGARIAGLSAAVTVTWVASSPAPTPSPASTPTRTPLPTAVATPTPAPPPPSSAVASTPIWSGYVVGNGPYTAATGTFNVPRLYGGPTETQVAEWVGVDGWNQQSLIQAGIDEVYDPNVSTTQFRIFAWWEVLPAYGTMQPIAMAISAGNSITATVSQVAPGAWDLSVTDNTTGTSFTTEQAYSGQGVSAEWIVEAPTAEPAGTVDTLAEFTPAVTFTNDRFNGIQTSLTDVVMVQNGIQVSTPSILSASGSFTVAYGSSSPPAP